MMTAMYDGDFAEIHRREVQGAAARERDQTPRDDARHLRQLVADQAGLMGTLVQRVEALHSMMRDLVDASLTPDVRDIVDQLHQIRAHSNEADVMNSAYRVELQRYHDTYGPLDEVGTDGSIGEE